ncbi:MAG: hypothetical protein PVG66_01695 [Chromatiales bacterium]|jgi:hypothetical protein
MDQQTTQANYLAALKGSFTSALRWHNLDELWQVLRDDPLDDWFIYAIGSDVPQQPSTHAELLQFIDKIDQLLRQEHEEDYCGIVYADNLKQPQMIKIYDPNNLGVVCGFSDNPPLPGWILSKIPPVDLVTTQIVPNNRKNWWRKLFG